MAYVPYPLVPKPDHVPAELVYSIDMNAPPGGTEDIHRAWKRLQDSSPDIVWTPHNGGHWILMRAEDIDFAQKNHDPFSMRSITVPTGTAPIRVLPLEVDPPQHAPYRALLNSSLSPKAVSALQGSVRELCFTLIDGFYEKGECEFIRDFALQLPITIFMKLADLPMNDREKLLDWAEMGVRPKSANDRAVAFGNMIAYIDQALIERRRQPGADIVSAVMSGRVEDRDLTVSEIHSMLMSVLFGGLDTVAASMGFAAYFLAGNPAHRHQLVAESELIPNAVEELLRRHGVSSTGRVISRDVIYKGVQLLAGDCVLIEPLLFGLDERRFENPLDVDFKRKNFTHAAFGNGPHRCPGSMLARSELRIFLEVWLKRIPDFAIKEGMSAVFAPGQVNAVRSLPLVWQP